MPALIVVTYSTRESPRESQQPALLQGHSIVIHPAGKLRVLIVSQEIPFHASFLSIQMSVLSIQICQNSANDHIWNVLGVRTSNQCVPFTH